MTLDTFFWACIGFVLGIGAIDCLQHLLRGQPATLRPREPDDLFDQWTCHVCKRWRPDAAINVRSHSHVYPRSIQAGCNIRYCNDNDDCIVQSMVMCWQSRVVTQADDDAS